ncbi:MAG: hypothetical protein HY686_06395 [Chloroflexi bacterium]|nr:hypothetical protein [Chloroflexota bacterium]
MALSFEHGSAGEPKGHALLYFRDALDPSRCYATYIIVLPVPMNLAKYMPPFLASQMAGVNPRELSAFAIPPVPEEVESHQRLELLAKVRGDDVLYGGTVHAAQISDVFLAVNDTAQEYGQACSGYLETAASRPLPGDTPSALGVEEVLYGLMGERDKLAELAKSIGKLRFAVEGGDRRLVEETEREIGVLARHLPEKFHLERLLEVARDQSREAAELAQLYVERCYRLLDQDYAGLSAVEGRIQALERPPG